MAKGGRSTCNHSNVKKMLQFLDSYYLYPNNKIKPNGVEVPRNIRFRPLLTKLARPMEARYRIACLGPLLYYVVGK